MNTLLSYFEVIDARMSTSDKNLPVSGYNYSVFSFYLVFTTHFVCGKVMSSNMSRLEAHAGFFILLMKGIFDPSVL